MRSRQRSGKSIDRRSGTMGKNNKPADSKAPATIPTEERRRKAEKIVAEKGLISSESEELDEETRRILYELQVHQIELEMQNDELRRAEAALDASQNRYFDLYEMAPVGYCTLDKEGLIRQANLTASTLLGVHRNELFNKPISRFVLKEDGDHLLPFPKKVPCVLRTALLRTADDTPERGPVLGAYDGRFGGRCQRHADGAPDSERCHRTQAHRRDA